MYNIWRYPCTKLEDMGGGKYR